MRHGREATVEDLCRAGEDAKAELVNGELVIMSAGGGLHGYVAGQIFASLNAYERRTRRGVALPDNVGFIVNLPNRRSFSPDVAEAEPAVPGWTMPLGGIFPD